MIVQMTEHYEKKPDNLCNDMCIKSRSGTPIRKYNNSKHTNEHKSRPVQSL